MSATTHDYDPAYKPNPYQTLVLTLELDYRNNIQILRSNQISYEKAVATVLETTKLIKNSAHCKIIRKELDGDTLQFNKVHSMPKPNETDHFPIVVEIFFPKENSNFTTVFGQIHVNLRYYDGLTGMNTFFNVMEYLEHSTSNHPAISYMTGGKHFSLKNTKQNCGIKPLFHLLSLLYQFVLNILSLCMGQFTFFNGPLVLALEPFLNKRVQIKYTDMHIDYKDVVKISQDFQNTLCYPYVLYTVNYAPEVALGRSCNTALSDFMLYYIMFCYDMA